MRNVFIIALLAGIAIVGGIYPITWYIKSITVERSVNDAIEQLKSLHINAEYESLKVSGFPTHLTVTLVNPHLRTDVDDALKLLFPTNSEDHTLSPFGDMKPWKSDMRLNGSIQISVDAFSSQYQVRVNGIWHETDVLDGKTVSFIGKLGGEKSCSINVKRNILSAVLWDFRLSNNDPKQWLQDLLSIDCINPGYTIVDAVSQDLLMSGGAARLYLNHELHSEKQRDARLFLNYKDLEVLPAGNIFLEPYRRIFSSDPAPLIDLSLAGKNQLELDITYRGPSHLDVGEALEPMHIQLSKLHISNQLYRSDSTLQFNSTPKATSEEGALSFKTQFLATEPYDALSRLSLRDLITEIKATDTAELEAIQPYISRHSIEEIYAALSPAVPKLSPLGQITVALDLQYNGDQTAKTGQIRINSMELSATPYGITGNGNVSYTSSPLPQSDVNITCRECPNLISDTSDYLLRLQQAILTLAPERTPLFTAKEAAAFKGFLSTLVPPDSGTTFNYHIASNPNVGITINDKGLAEILKLYTQQVDGIR